jgi:hypothetical protein
MSPFAVRQEESCIPLQLSFRSPMPRTARPPNSSSVFSKRLDGLIAVRFGGSRKLAAQKLGLDAGHLTRLLNDPQPDGNGTRRGHRAQASTVADICKHLGDRELAIGLIEGYLLDELQQITDILGQGSGFGRHPLVTISTSGLA